MKLAAAKKAVIHFFTKNKKTILVILFIALLFYGFFLRLYKLGDESLWIDESMSALAAKKIHETGIPIYDSGFVYDRALVFHYLMSGMFFFGYTDFNARLISAIIGIATCVLIYFIAKEYDETVAWVAFVISIFLKVFIVYSRQARFYQFEMFFFFLTFYLLYKSLAEKRYLYFAIVPLIIAIDTHIFGFFLLPFFFYTLYVNKVRISWLILGLIPIVLYVIYRFNGVVDDFDYLKVKDYFDITRYYVPFLLLAIIGFGLSFKKKMSWFLMVAAVIVFIASGLHPFFGYRYVYLAYLPIIILFAVAISKIQFSWLRWSVFIVYIIWVSNLIMPIGYATILKPTNLGLIDETAPGGEFKENYIELAKIYKNETLIVTLGPEAEWYFKKPDHWLYFSYSNRPTPLNETYAYIKGIDVYTGADAVFSLDEFISVNKNSYVVIDDFAASRLSPEMLNYTINNCKLEIDKGSVSTYFCNATYEKEVGFVIS